MARASTARPVETPGRRGWLPAYERNVYLLLIFTLGKGFQLSINAVTNNLYVYSLGYDLRFVGVFAAMPALGALVAGVPVGILADRIGRKPLLVVSGILNPVALVAIALSTSVPLLLAASFINGILSSAYWVTNLPILTESTTEDQRVGVLALNNFLLFGVGALGALIGGVIPELAARVTHLPAGSTVPLRFGVLVAAVAVLLPALPLFTLNEPQRGASDDVPSLGQLTAPGAGIVAAQLVASTPVVASNRREITILFVKLLIPDLLFTTGEGVVLGLLQLFFALKFHLNPGSLGVIFTLAGLIGGATSLTAPRFVRRWGQLRIATTMQYLSAPVMLAIGFVPLLPFAASAELGRQVLRGLFEPVYAAFAMGRVTTRQRATLSGFYSLTWSMGFSIGPIMAGWLQHAAGPGSVFIVGAVCLTLSATLLRLFFGGSMSAGARPAESPTA